MHGAPICHKKRYYVHCDFVDLEGTIVLLRALGKKENHKEHRRSGTLSREEEEGRILKMEEVYVE